MKSRPSREEIAAFASSGVFNREWYVANFPDVALAGMDPAEHYLLLGKKLGRKPSPNFSNQDGVPKQAGSAQPLERGKIVAAESIRVRRRLDTWDHVAEKNFVGALSVAIAANPGYFERIPVSIIMPTYNRADYISRAVESVCQQSFEHWELIIVDDGSIDDTRDVVAPFQKDPRVKFIEAAHSGVSGARNMGLEKAQGKYVFYLDSDNTWDPTYLLYMVAFLEIAGVSAAYCGIRSINDSGEVQFYRGDHFDWQACLTQNYVDMNCFGHLNPGPTGHRFDSQLPRLVDWDFILRITADLPTAFVPYCGVTYYDGTEGARITRTVASGDALKPLEDRVRGKHPESLIPARQAASLRPRFRTAKDLMRRGLPGDQLSRGLLAHEAALIDWPELSRRQREADFVSVIVLGFNNVDMSIGCIESILNARTSLNFEIIFVDNASDDNTPELVGAMAAKDARLSYVRSKTNLMFSLGNNYGLQFARGEYTIFLNNDTLVRDGWMDVLIEGLQNDPTIGATGPKLLYPDETLQCGGIVFSEKSKIPYHIYRGLDQDAEEINKSRAYQALTGACVAFRTQEVITLRGFDPIFINGCEDLDLCFRLRKRLGKRSVYLPQSVVVHLESKSKGRGKHIGRNRKLFVKMWGKYVRPDDTTYYHEDGYDVTQYDKPGAEPHGDEASYVPVLELAKKKARRVGPVNVGFSTMWYPRGISFHTDQLAKALESRDVQTHIFARWESHRFENGGAIHHPRVFNAGDDPSSDTIVKWAEEHAIDVMIFMEVHPNDWKRVQALKNAGIRVVCYENLDVMRFEQVGRYEIFDYFLFNCFHSRERILSIYPHKKSLMIPWGAEKAPAISDMMFDDGMDRDVDNLVEFVHIGGWGGINNRKNTDLLIRAFDQIEDINARLHIYTQTPISSYGQDIVTICQYNDQIVVHEGTVEDIDIAYQGKSVLLWPSKREGVGLPILESVVRGIPVVISDGYMMKQWIIPGEHGWICDGKPRPGQFVLSELEVDTTSLIEVIKDLVANPNKIKDAQDAIDRDQWVWDWSWQIELFRSEMLKIALNPKYTPSDDLGYLPKKVLGFERQRRSYDNAGVNV